MHVKSRRQPSRGGQDVMFLGRKRNRGIEQVGDPTSLPLAYDT
jgi:hypothetical protein